MNLTIDYRHTQSQVRQAAAAAVIAAAVRVGHTVTLTAGADTATFSLDDGCVAVTGEHPDRAAIDPAEWAGRIAATATRLIRHPAQFGLSPGERRRPGDNSPRLATSPVARRRRRRPLTGS